MMLKTLDHVNLRTHRVGEMVAWYRDILGMESGARPDFGFPGAWLYLGGNPIIHLVGVPREPANEGPKIEHFAIGAEGLAAFTAHLDRHRVSYSVDRVPGIPLVQVNLRDCDGNHIHVDFHSDELAETGA